MMKCLMVASIASSDSKTNSTHVVQSKENENLLKIHGSASPPYVIDWCAHAIEIGFANMMGGDLIGIFDPFSFDDFDPMTLINISLRFDFYLYVNKIQPRMDISHQ